MPRTASPSAARRSLHRRTLPLVTTLAALAVAGCGGGDDDGDRPTDRPAARPSTPRELARAVETICADEVDVRTRDRAPEFLRALADEGPRRALAAAEYNQRALGRVHDRLTALAPSDDGLRRALRPAIDATARREQAWGARIEALRGDGDGDGGAPRTADERRTALLRMIRIGQDTTGLWSKAVGDLGVDEPDCGPAVP